MITSDGNRTRFRFGLVEVKVRLDWSFVQVRFGSVQFDWNCSSGSVLVYQSRKITLQYTCILHLVLQSGGLSQLKCLSKTHTDKNITSFMKWCVVIQIWEFFSVVGIKPLPQSSGSVRIAWQFSSLWSAITLRSFGSLSPKIGFEFGSIPISNDNTRVRMTSAALLHCIHRKAGYESSSKTKTSLAVLV